MDAFNDMIRRLTVVFGEPRTEDPKAFIAEYRRAIGGYRADVVAKTTDIVIDTSTFWPRPAEIKQAAFKAAADIDAANGIKPTDWDAVEAERRQGWRLSDLDRVAVDAAAKARVQAMVDRLKRDLAAKRLDEADPVAPDWQRGHRDGFEEMQRTSPSRMHRA